MLRQFLVRGGVSLVTIAIHALGDDNGSAGCAGHGHEAAKRNAGGKWILPVPGTFVIDRSGHIAYAHVDADYRNRPEPQEIVVAVCRSLRR